MGNFIELVGLSFIVPSSARLGMGTFAPLGRWMPAVIEIEEFGELQL